MPNTNTSPATATVIASLDYEVTVDAPINVDEFLWWKYTAQDGDLMIGAIALSSNEAVFEQRLNIFFGDDPDDLTHLNGPGLVKQWITSSVNPGVTYYFRVLDETIETDNTGLTLTLRIRSAPPVTTPGGIYVPSESFEFDDGSAYSGIVIDPDGVSGPDAILGAIYGPSNERGDTDLDGRALVQDLWTDEVVLLNVYAGTEIRRFTFSELDPESGEVKIVCNRTTGNFWVLGGGVSGALWKIEPDGTLTGPVATLVNSLGTHGSSIQTLGIKRDETVCYFGNASMQAWDLVNDVDLGLFIPRPTVWFNPMKEMVVLPDDTMIIGWTHSGGAEGTKIGHYDANGDLILMLFELATGESSVGGRLAYAENDPATSFWWRQLWYPDRFREVQVSDGTVLRLVTAYENGGGIGPDSGDEPDPPGPQLFGPENSCPFWILSGTVEVEPTTGTITVVKAELAEATSDTPVFTFTMSPPEDFDPNTFTLEPGESMTFNDVPPGSGYGVSEASLAGWDLTSTLVSNGSASVNLTVDVGETVTVTFTNAADVCECCVSTQLQITNHALAKLGQTRFITDLDEATAEGYTAAQLWDLALRAALRHWDWPFATKYAGGADATDGYMNLIDGSESDPAVADEWVYAYRYPLDCLKARRIVKEEGVGRAFDPEPIPFRVGRTWNGVNDVPLIYCNVEDAVLEYTALVECSEEFFDALFEDALSWRLAGLMAPGLTRTAKTAQECMAMFMAVLDMAKAVAAQESQQEPHGQASWTRSRE